VANSEQFVPQTSNFELVGGVNFRKGCYPGQEIVARSQYLGKLKQRAAIAQVAGEATALEDVFQQGDSNPVGRVIQSTIQSAQGGINSTVLFEAPHSLIENQTTLTVGSATGAVLQVKPLPYPVVDITA
jgi:folate-binding protein YgfZ